MRRSPGFAVLLAMVAWMAIITPGAMASTPSGPASAIAPLSTQVELPSLPGGATPDGANLGAAALSPDTEVILRFAPGQRFYGFCTAAVGTTEAMLEGAEIRIKYSEAYKQDDGQMVSDFSLAKSYSYGRSGVSHGLSGELTGTNTIAIDGLFSWDSGRVISGHVTFTMDGMLEESNVPPGADPFYPFNVLYTGNLTSSPFVDSKLPNLGVQPGLVVQLSSVGTEGGDIATFSTKWTVTVKGQATPEGWATVEQAGTTSMVGRPTGSGQYDWKPLLEGDVLGPGCVILVGAEGDPQAGGGRVVISLSPTFSCVIEPHSRVEIREGGIWVESGSIEVGDKAPLDDYTAYSDNGFCSGKDPGATQPPFSAQTLSVTDLPVPAPHALAAAASLAPAASGDVRYRLEVLSDGTSRVSVLEGAAEVRSTATQATTLLRAGQQITLSSQGLGPVSEKSFTDVPTAHPYHTAIIGMALKEIVNGYKKGDLWEFRPGDPVKRAQFAKMIVGAMTIAPKVSTQTRFTDLGSPDSAGYPHVYVQAAYDNKITTGTNTAQTLFAPWDPIKRAQVVTMIVRAANELWPGVLQTPPTSWSGQMASFTDKTHGTNMRIAEYNGLLAGLDGFGRTWDPWAQATRGEVAQMLWNLMTR